MEYGPIQRLRQRETEAGERTREGLGLQHAHRQLPAHVVVFFILIYDLYRAFRLERLPKLFTC